MDQIRACNHPFSLALISVVIQEYRVRIQGLPFVCIKSSPIFTYRCNHWTAVLVPNPGFSVLETSHSPAAQCKNLGSRKEDSTVQQQNDKTPGSPWVWRIFQSKRCDWEISTQKQLKNLKEEAKHGDIETVLILPCIHPSQQLNYHDQNVFFIIPDYTT